MQRYKMYQAKTFWGGIFSRVRPVYEQAVSDLTFLGLIFASAYPSEAWLKFAPSLTKNITPG
jgi:hypothetical protein